MADYAQYAAAASTVLGYSVKDFLDAFEENTSRQNQAAIDASPTAQVILEFTSDKDEWSGSSSELHKLLKDIAVRDNLSEGGPDGFPKNSNWLWKKIVKVRPNLLALGIKATLGETNRNSVIRLEKTTSRGLDISSAATTSTSSSESSSRSETDAANTATDNESVAPSTIAEIDHDDKHFDETSSSVATVAVCQHNMEYLVIEGQDQVCTRCGYRWPGIAEYVKDSLGVKGEK